MAHEGFTRGESEFIKGERVMRFNSTSGGGEIHSVPVCFAFDGSNFFVHAKRYNAKRWKNIKLNNSVSLELDSYSDDWSKLKGVLILGKAGFLESGHDHERGLALLREKYPQYAKGPSALTRTVTLVRIVPHKVTSWYLEGGSVPRFGSY